MEQKSVSTACSLHIRIFGLRPEDDHQELDAITNKAEFTQNDGYE